jgi:hypothetical protein
MVGLVTQNETTEENTQKDKPICLIFGKKISFRGGYFEAL